jgi:hypothetical protein
MSRQLWTDDLATNFAPIGTVGFLARHDYHREGRAAYFLEEKPCHTNMSHDPKLHGWCGTTNDVATHAMGLARVSQVTKNGRVRPTPLKDSEVPEALRGLGWPSL